jgi:glycosyltransferase involved in cell wall biosynthesis
LNLLVLNLAVDADHSTLGHTTAWINELARHCETVSVITMYAGRIAVAENVAVYSLGKELGRSEPRRLLEFYRVVHRVLSRHRVDACFAHMAPLFALLLAPVAKARRLPVLLWYAHPTVRPLLRLATAAVDRCVTATAESFRVPSRKVFAIGHGIDTERFAPPAQTAPSYETTAISVGRITPRKRLQELLQAVAILECEREHRLQLELIGGPATPGDRTYERRLRREARSLAIDGLVRFRGPVPFSAMPPYYHRGSVSVNLSDGALDKAILESMASGCIPVSRNPAFAALARARGLDALVPAPGPRGLADCIAAALRRDRAARSALVTQLRRIVVEEHSLTTLSDRILAHLAELVEAGRGGRRHR